MASKNLFAALRRLIEKEDATDAAVALVEAIPTVDPEDDGVTIWNDGGVLKVSGPSV